MKKWCKRLGAGLIAASTLVSSVPVSAQESEKKDAANWQYQTSWEEVSALLDKHLGVYDEPSKFDPTTRHTPDGPLMGNSTILGLLAGKTTGDKKNQTIYISRLDNFEELNKGGVDLQYVGYGGIDIKRTDGGEANGVDFRLEQDMKLAEVKGISESGFQTDTWLSAKENIIVSEITNLTEEPMDLDISVWTNVTDKVSAGISGVDAGVDEERDIIYASRKTGSDIYDWSVNSTTAVKLLDKEAVMNKVDDHTSKLSVNLEANESICMVTAVEGGKDSETDHEDAVNKIVSLDSQEKIDEAKAKHQSWWKEYWIKSYLDLDEASDSIEKSFYGFMYQIGCAIQAMSENPSSGVTAGLFPWTGSSAPNWQGDYTLNSDVQRPIGVAVTANRLDHIDNYTQVIEDFWSAGVENASNTEHLNWLIAGSDREKFTAGIRGSLYPTHIGPWGSRTEHFNAPNDYFCSPANGTMVLQPLVQYYKATLDEEYLNKTLYPMVREQANFWTDYAEKEGGQYNIYGATYEDTTAHKNAIMDLTSAEFMLKNAIAFSEHMGVDDELRAQWKEVHDNLAPYPTKNGYYIEDERGNDPTTASNFNVYGFAFYDLVGSASSQEEKDKILLWLENKQEFGTNPKQVRAAVTSARVGFDPHIWLDKMKAGYMDCAPDDWSGIRPNNTVGDIGGSLFAGAIMESLMQSHEGFIHFFPAWYDEQEASFKDLRAYGAFTVSGRQNVWGQVEGAAIRSEKGGACSVLNPWQEDNLETKVYKDGKEIKTTVEKNSLGDVYTFQTEAGANYELVPSGKLPESIDIQQKEEALFIEDTLQLSLKTNAEKEIVWNSSDESIATVKEGVVTPVKVGDVTITAALKDNKQVSDTCIVHVVEEKKIPSEELSAIADSEEDLGGDGPGSSAVDGKENTIWHSGYSQGMLAPDIANNQNNSITIDLGNTYNISRMDYLPRQSASPNGTITKYEIWYSTDAEGENFKKIMDGNWEATQDKKQTSFDATTCRRIRVRAMETFGGTEENKNKWISAAEFYFYRQAEKGGAVKEIVTDIPAIRVSTGTTWETVLKLLPEKVEVKLSNDSTSVLSVEWNPETYTGESGTVTGNLVCKGNITNPEQVEIKAEIIVEKGDKKALENLYNQYAALERGMYTNKSWDALQEALANAKGILDSENPTEQDMVNATLKLEAAKSDLKEIEGIELDKKEVTAYVGIPKKLILRNNTEQTLAWSSSDEKIATVDKDGNVTSVSGGTVTITVNTQDKAHKDTCQMTVQRNERNFNFENPVFASSGHHDDFVPEKAADGKTGGSQADAAAYAWVSPNAPHAEAKWIMTSFPEPVTIDKWRVTHINNGDPKCITKEFELQTSVDGSEWTTVDTVSDNTELVNERTFVDNGQITSKYFRLYITKADNYNGQWPNNMARIDEWELLYEYGNYFVEFKPGEGTGETENQEFIYNEEKSLNKNVFTKEGYIFDGWMDEKGNKYADGQAVLNLDPNRDAVVTLTAQWKPVSYQISYQLNQGEGTVPESTGCVYDTEAVLASTDGITRAGYEVKGWNTKSDGTGTDYASKAAVTNLSTKDEENIILYAKWEKAEIKSLLERYLDKAKEHVNNGDTQGLIESVQKLFEEAIAGGDAVMEKADATKEEVTAATLKLMKAIHALDFYLGDKTDLEMALELTKSIDLSKYVEAKQAEYNAAKAEAERVMGSKDVLQPEVDTAWKALADAILELRLKADKSVLGELIKQAEGIDTKLYTEVSVEPFAAALKDAKAILEDETMTSDDQPKVDKAAEKLDKAIKGLQAKADNGNNGGNNTGNNTGNNNGTGSNSGNKDTGADQKNHTQKAAKTGDTTSILFTMTVAGFSVMLILAASIVLVRKKRR